MIKKEKKMKKIKKIAMVTMAAAMMLAFCACGGGDNEGGTATLTIAKQHGMAYAPLLVMEEQGLIEKNYDGDVNIEWSTLNSGSAITEGFASGNIDFGAMGVAPAVIATTTEGMPVKICSNMSAQPHKLMTSNPDIKTLEDVGSKQIALVNINSIQHILLAMAADQQLGDAHALDNNIVAMAHPDGMSSLLSGSVELQLTTSPYTFKEEAEGMAEVDAIAPVWPEGNSFILALASTELQENNPALYDAVVAALAEAIDWINNNKEEAAELLCENEGVDAATMLEWLNDPACVYSTETKGVLDMAGFMAENGFLKNDAPKELSDIAFDNVKGN